MESEGFDIHRGILAEGMLPVLRDEADRMAGDSKGACARALLARSPLFAKLACSPVLLALIPSGFEPVRSLLFDKTPENNWPVAWHRDQTIAVRERRETAGYSAWTSKDGFFQVRPPLLLLESMVTLRLHLDNADSSNGALRVLRGSHRDGLGEPPASISRRREFECACRARDVLRMRPLLFHASSRAMYPCHRRVIHLEYADRRVLASGLTWAEGPKS